MASIIARSMNRSDTRTWLKDLRQMVLGLLPIAFAIWLATVMQFGDVTDHASSHEQRSHLSERPIYGPVAGNHLGEYRAGVQEVPRLQCFPEPNDVHGPSTLGAELTRVRSEVSGGVESGCRGDVLYSDDFVNRDRPIYGLRSWDFQLADVEFSRSTIFDDVVFTLRYRSFQVFRFSQDRLSAQSVLQIAPGLYGMVDHAFRKIIDTLSNESISLLSGFKNLWPLRGFVFIQIFTKNA